MALAVRVETRKDRNTSELWVPGVVEPSLANQSSAAANCGIKASRASLTNYAGTVNATDGQSFSGYNFTGPINVTGATTWDACWMAGNVTGSDGGALDSRAAGVTRTLLRDCTIQPDTPTGYTDGLIGHHITAQRCIIRGVDGVGSYNTHAAAVDNHIEGSYLGPLDWYDPDPTGEHNNGTHNDPIQHQGGTGLYVIGNAIHGYINDRTGNAISLPNPSGSNSGPFPWLQTGQLVLVQNNTGFSCLDIHVIKNWCYGSFNGLKFDQAGDDVECVDNLFMDNGQTKDGSHSNHIRVAAGLSINGQTFATGYYDMPSGWNDAWGFTGVDAFGTAVTAGQTAKIRVD